MQAVFDESNFPLRPKKTPVKNILLTSRAELTPHQASEGTGF